MRLPLTTEESMETDTGVVCPGTAMHFFVKTRVGFDELPVLVYVTVTVTSIVAEYWLSLPRVISTELLPRLLLNT